MRTKFKSIIFASIILLSVFFINWDIDLNAKNLENEIDSNSTSRSYELPRAGGFEWGPIEVISEPIFGQDNNIGHSVLSKIAIENDRIYVVWEDKSDYNGSGGDLDIFYRYFDGQNWSNIQVISEPVAGQNLNSGDSNRPCIAVDDGKIYVVWYDSSNINNAGSDVDIFFRCNLSGSSWEEIQVISEPVPGNNINIGGSWSPKIAVENRKIYVVWQDNNNTNNAGTEEYNIFYKCNLTGSSWEPVQVISEPVPGKNFKIGDSAWPDIAVENGNIYVVWHDTNDTNYAGSDDDIFFRCNISGTNWEPIQVISEPIINKNFNTGSSYAPAVTVENNKIYIVWFDNNNTDNAGDDVDIFYRCNLTSSRWENIQIISEPVFDKDLNIQGSMNPEIEVEYGLIYIVWYDYNNTNSAGNDNDIFLRCNFTGSYWEPVQVISEPELNKDINTKGSYDPDIAIYHGKNHITWTDENNTYSSGSDYDIFYRSIFHPLVLNLPEVTPFSGNTSTNFNFTITYFKFDNMSPTEISVKIDDLEHSMAEVDPYDSNYIDGKEYFFKIKNLDIGLHFYKFYTSDGLNSISTKIFNNPIVYNFPPRISTEDNITAYEDVYYEVEYDYEDIDFKNVGQVITWNFSTNAEWLTFDRSTAILNGTPTNDDVGEYWVNVSIDDTMDSDFTNFTLTVVNVNDVPVIIIEDIKIIREDEYYENYYKATDVDSPQDSLSWNMQTNASWLDFEQSTAKLSGIPENEDVGESWVNISVSDGEYIDYSNFTLKVINVNDPPRIITVNNITAVEDDFYEMIYKAEDVDNTHNELFWDINTNAKWLNYDIPIAVINGTPTNDDIGEYWVNISVSDNEFIDFTNFTLTVVNTNDPPTIITEDKTNATADELYSINYEAEDIDPPPITLSWFVNTNTSGWLTIDKYNGWLNGIPSLSDVGTYWVNVTVTDGENGWDFHNFTLEVLRTPFQKNHAPQLLNASMTPIEGDIKTEFTFSVHYYDADGDVPVFIQLVIGDAAYNMKLKLDENASNSTYEYKIILPEGTHNYYFIAFDGSETVRTNNLTTPDIKNIDKISTEEISWYWLFLIVIVIIIIIVLILMLVLKKRKAMKLPTVQAEMLRATPEPIALPGATPSADIATPLAAQPIISEQLPSPKIQVQPSEAVSSETISVPSLAPTTIETQFQLPKATLSKAQKLELLEERFLRGEVDLETYKELKTKIESHTGEDITRDESEELPVISEPQQPEYTQQPETQESTEVQHKLQQQTPQPQPTTKSQQQEKSSEQDDSQSSSDNQQSKTNQQNKNQN